MRAPPAPIRFLIVVIGAWGAMRSVMLMPDWSAAAPVPEETAAPGGAVATLPPPVLSLEAQRSGEAPSRLPRRIGKVAPRPRRAPADAVPRVSPADDSGRGGPWLPGAGWSLAPRAARNLASAPLAPAIITAAAPGRSRWAFSGWIFYRSGGRAAALAPGGALGGSQAGARATYALRRRAGTEVALSARVYAPLDDRRGAEGAVGLDWKPLPRVPVRLLAERRQALGRDGRSAFSLTLYGGVDAAPAGPLRLDAYAQAGAVGARRRDLFADGAARLTVAVGPLRIGGGAWAAAQPGVSRLDAGPHADVRLRAGRGTLALSADWRFRLAGRASPGSGPALTLSTGF